MRKTIIFNIYLCLIVLIVATNSFAQKDEVSSPKTPLAEKNLEEIPVLVKHLPNWTEKQKNAILLDNSEDLRKTLGNRPIFNEIEFIQGTEAVIAEYDAGKLLILEFNTPQTSVLTDERIKENLGNSEETIFYRRIGNYNVLIFDGNDEVAANALLDQIKYQKVVQWLGSDYTVFRQKERAFIEGTSSLFISTVLVIVSILGVALVFGFLIGVIYFYRRNQRFAAMDQFSDAGGMTRLNLDGFTPEIVPENSLDK